jgi:hypothetical protein
MWRYSGTRVEETKVEEKRVKRTVLFLQRKLGYRYVGYELHKRERGTKIEKGRSR